MAILSNDRNQSDKALSTSCNISLPMALVDPVDVTRTPYSSDSEVYSASEPIDVSQYGGHASTLWSNRLMGPRASHHTPPGFPTTPLLHCLTYPLAWPPPQPAQLPSQPVAPPLSLHLQPLPQQCRAQGKAATTQQCQASNCQECQAGNDACTTASKQRTSCLRVNTMICYHG
jgi:hypothetical protein